MAKSISLKLNPLKKKATKLREKNSAENLKVAFYLSYLTCSNFAKKELLKIVLKKVLTTGIVI